MPLAAIRTLPNWVNRHLWSAFGEQNVSLSISFATINVRPQLNQPVHNYKFENSLRDSYSANVITSGYAQPLAELSYVASSQFVPGLGSFARRATTYGQIYQPIMSGFATGPTVWDSTAYTQRSYTFSLWLQFPYTTLDQNPTGGNNSASTITLHFASVRLYLTLPKGSVSCPYYVNWTPTQPGGGLSTTLASGAIQPGPVTVPAGNQVGGKFFIAITYNHVSQTARVVTGESGTLSSFPSASLAPSNYDFGEPGGSVSIVGSNAFSPITGVATIGAYFDDFRVYNYALNEYEIANIYNNGAGDVIPAQGFGVGAFAPITIYSIAGSAFSTYGGPLETVNLVTLNGSASGTQSSTTSGTLAEITVTPFGAIAQGNPFGPFATLSVVPFAGTASYTPASGFPVILIRSVAGRATGSSVRSASFATLSISSLSGSGAGSATNSSNLAAITISSLAGSSAGNGLASASFAGLTIVNHAGSASGSGNSSGASNTITITTLSGSAASNALASSAFSIITILPLAGSAIGQGSATGSSNTITVTSFSGAVAALANTSGMLSIIQVQVFTGSIVTNGNAVGPLGGGPGFPLFNGTAIRLDSIQPPLGGVAFGGTAKFINAPFNTVILTPLEGTGIGNVLNVYLNSQPFSSVSITSQQGSAIGSSLGGGNFGLQPPVIQLSLGSAGLSVSASTSGPLQTITVQSLSGTSQGAAIIAGSLSVVAVSPLQGSSIGSSVISAVFQTASILPPNGSASSSIIVSGSLTAITIGAFSGGTTVGVTALSQGATIVVLPILGSPNGTNIVSGGRASVTTYHSI